MKFTGHERDDVNLDYMHARYYLPFGGRFLSVDPGKDWDDTKPQSWNLYTYARNNPVGNTDPNGKETRVFIAGQASIFSNYKGSFGHAALLVTDGDRRQGISEGGDAHPVKNGELGFAKTYLAQDRDVFVFVIKTTAEQDRAMINYLDKTNPGEIRTSGQVDTFPAGSNNNCTTAVVNVLKAGGVIPKSADPNGANSGYHLPGELRKALEPAGDLDGNVKERTKVQAEADRKPAS
jgi:RHS repeat-associated protein